MAEGSATSRRALLMGTAMGAPFAAGLLSGSASADPLGPRRPPAPTVPNAPGGSASLAVGWHILTENVVAAAAFPEPITQSRTWAVSWLAAARATKGQKGTYASAAFVQALHDTLIVLVPAQKTALDAALGNSLATIPNGSSKTAGIHAGAAAAAAVLAERANDGTDTASVDTTFTPAAPAPGLWQLTPPTTRPAARAGQENAKPFLLKSNDQFDPGPPPALNSKIYLDDLAESAAIGRADAPRSPEQYSIAKFWYPGITGFSAQITRQLLAAQSRDSLAELSKLVAVLHVTSVDAQIHLAKVKYKYLFWRPYTAITTGTVHQDPTWASLEVTPQHPEYPSGHALQGGAQQVVLDALIGPSSPVAVALTSSNFAGQSRLYTDWATINTEIINARVWEGVHFRNSDKIGSALGKQVTRYGLANLRHIGL